MKKLLLFFLFLVLIYQIELVFVPYKVSVTLGGIGLIIHLLFGKRKNNQIEKKANAFYFFKYIIPLLVVSIISIFLNSPSDIHYVKYVVFSWFGFYAVYLLAFSFQKIYGEFTIDVLIRYCILSMLFYLAISLILFINPPLMEVAQDFVRIDEVAENALERVQGMRLIGIGISYFSFGGLGGALLILFSFYLCLYRNTVVRTLSILLCYLLIILLGVMMSRTIAIGGLIGFVVLFLYFFHNRFFRYRILLISLVVLLVSIIGHSVFEMFFIRGDLEALYSFGFEGFINYSETGEFDLVSTNKMAGQYSIIPDNLFTWIIGEAQWLDSSGFGYYKNVDIGFLRNIFYFGILGLACLLFFYYKSFELSFQKNSFRSRIVLIVMFLYYIILGAKGITDLLDVTFLFYFTSIETSTHSKISPYKIK